jgi:two-component system, cell cycle sensor histidine kinase and response regulator CckA
MQSSQGKSGETILLVEDEAALRELIRLILQNSGYQVLEASSSVEALEICEQHVDDIDLLFTDLRMPIGLNGWDLAQKLSSQRPDLHVLYTSGSSLESFAGPATSEQHFLKKPFNPDALIHAVRRCLTSAPARTRCATASCVAAGH